LSRKLEIVEAILCEKFLHSRRREDGLAWLQVHQNSDSPELDDIIAAVDGKIVNGGEQFESSEAAKGLLARLKNAKKVLDPSPADQATSGIRSGCRFLLLGAALGIRQELLASL
jgi:hypothetical protein